MNPFKHQHSYCFPQLKDNWTKIHNEIIVKGNPTVKFPVKCKCGHIDNIEYCLSLQMTSRRSSLDWLD